MRDEKYFEVRMVLVALAFFVFVLFVFATPPVWQGSNINYTHSEDSIHLHNFTLNISGYDNDVSFSFETDQNNITLENASGTNVVSVLDISPWIQLNDTTGVLRFNTTYDNQTGFYKIPIQADNTTDSEGSITIFEFIINATNDALNFSDIETNYSYDADNSNPGYNITIFDEESHYPINFTIDFYDCTHASWLGIPDGTNCTLFNLTNFSNNEAHLNYSGTSSDIGTYYATVTAYEAPHSCPHSFCDASYTSIQEVSYNITVSVLASMEVNVSSCYNQQFVEGVPENCTIQIITEGSDDVFNLTGNADFLTYGGTPDNITWFYQLTEHTASGNVKDINITVNASHSLVGNWEMNMSAYIMNATGDLQDFNWSLLPIFVNWTGNSNMTLSSFSPSYITSVNLNTSISFTATDIDFEIEDKDFYDEDATLNITVINDTSGLEVYDFFYFTNGSVSGDTLPANITFSPNSSHAGNYTVTINVTDESGVMDFDTFSLQVFDNNFPYWNDTEYSFNFTVNSTPFTTISNITSLNLSRTYANDSDVEDTLTFTNSSGAPPRFSLSSAGILNFFPYKEDVGYWEFNVTVTDDLGLSNTTPWTLNISNINTPVSFRDSLFDFNGSSSPPFEANVSEPTETTIHILDDDIFISNSQISSNGAYNESFNVTTTIVNTTFVPTPISFSYVFDVENPTSNDTLYVASFTPQTENRGNYTVTVNVTDASGENDSYSYNLTITGLNTAPTIQNISNQETAFTEEYFNFTVFGNDTQDDAFGYELNYTISALNGGPDLSINLTNGFVSYNFSDNQSYVGNWTYQVIVNDSEGASTSQNFSLFVNGYVTVVLPSAGYTYTGVENDDVLFDINVSYAIAGLNLTYEFYIDNVTYSSVNGSDFFTYTNLSESLSDTYTYATSSNLTFNYSLHGLDETYGRLKNISLVIYRAGFSNLNETITYKINVSHADEPLQLISNISDQVSFETSPVSIDLTDYFLDSDSIDPYYNQVVSFMFNQSDETGVTIGSFSTFSGWNLSMVSPVDGVYNLSIIGNEKNITTNESVRNVTSNWFTFTVLNPVVQNNPSSGGGGSSSTRTVLEHFALKIVNPGDIDLSPDNYIDLNFTIVNTGNVLLQGIDLSSIVELDGDISRDIEINLSNSYIDSLAVGESREYTMRVFAQTDAVGEYRAVVFANVTSPKFSDWGEFFIKVKSLDESQISQLLIFTDKFISENPECLELRELYNEAVASFDGSNLEEAQRLAQETIRACEDAITSNEQISYFDERVQTSILFSVILTVALFAGALVYYFYRRIKFKKLIDKDYI